MDTARPPSAPPLAWHDALISLAIFGVVLCLFVLSPLKYMGDSKYTLLLTNSLMSHGSFVLDGYDIPRQPVLMQGNVAIDGSIYQIEIVDGHLYNYLPPGTAILSAPFVLAANALGDTIFDRDHHYDTSREAHLQRFVASFLMAGLAVVFYHTARLLLAPGWSAAIALGGVLCTQAWSTASRALWTHTWGITLLGVVLYLLLARETGRHRLFPGLLATLLSWTYFVRPTNSIFIVGCTVYMLLYERALFVRYAATGAAWFAAFVVWSWAHFGHLLPSYYQANRLEAAGFWEALPGNLVSPSRGLFVYVPVTLFVLYLAARYWRRQPCPSLAWLTAGVSLCHLAAVSCFGYWYGGQSYGPRFTTELVPWFVLLAVLGCRAALDEREDYCVRRGVWPWRITLAAGGVLALASMAIQYRGATQAATALWNNVPVSIDDEPARLWNWRYPQFLAGITDQPPDVFPALHGRVGFDHGGGAACKWTGWNADDPDVSWTDQHRARLVFTAEDLAARRLRLAFTTHLHPPRLPRQRVSIYLNGVLLAGLTIDQPQEHEYAFELPPGALQRKNVLTFDLPDAISPRVASEGADDHRLGIALRWLELL